MNVEHAARYILAGGLCTLAVLAACFLIGFVVTCGVWQADGYMAAREERRERERETREALRTVDDDYARLCEDPDLE